MNKDGGKMIDYPFRMYGRIIQIYRYKVEYTDKSTGNAMLAYCCTDEEAKDINGTVTKLDTSNYEWLDGIEVADVPDTFAEAIKIYDMGETAYKEQLAVPTESEQLRADMDYLAVMMGVEL
jgi:hypothetical protein